MLTPLILASGSPRRSRLMEEAGYRFEILAPNVDENFDRNLFADEPSIARALAVRKARAVSSFRPDSIVLGADTMVVTRDHEILGKPVDRSDAVRMIGMLGGRSHEVHTAVALVCGDSEWCESDTAVVKFRPLSADEIAQYVATGEGDDKAGAYGYQGVGRGLVESIEGDEQTVIGLPMRLVERGMACLNGTKRR